jgi:hypothetical protein
MWMAIPGISHFHLKENGQNMVELWGVVGMGRGFWRSSASTSCPWPASQDIDYLKKIRKDRKMRLHFLHAIILVSILFN